MIHFNWTQLIPEVGHDYIHVATAAGAGTVLVGLSVLGKMALGGGETAVLPADRFSLKGFSRFLLNLLWALQTW